MKVKFKKLHKDAVLLKYAREGDAGMDLITVTDPVVTEKYIEYKFGLSMEIPKGFAAFIFPRSSISKTDLELCNAVGIIDSGYRGEIQVRFNFNQITFDMIRHFIVDVNGTTYIDGQKIIKNYINRLTMYKKGDKIAQMIILPIPKIEPEWSDELSETVRGSGGFGSTD